MNGTRVPFILKVVFKTICSMKKWNTGILHATCSYIKCWLHGQNWSVGYFMETPPYIWNCRRSGYTELFKQWALWLWPLTSVLFLQKMNDFPPSLLLLGLDLMAGEGWRLHGADRHLAEPSCIWREGPSIDCWNKKITLYLKKIIVEKIISS